jgi:putative transcriptional regulator
LLIAMPAMGDPRFSRTVIYMCSHNAEGAMGLVINKPYPGLTFPNLLTQLGIESTTDNNIIVRLGGPVETGRGFVLHSADFFIKDSTLPIDAGICLTATLDILKAIAAGKGPANAVLALGYAGWAPGQLETEIQGNGWLHCPADPELIFGADTDKKYMKALDKIGIDLGKLSSDVGHA